MILKLVIGGGVIFGVSIHMAITSRDTANFALVGFVAIVVFVLGAVIYSNIRCCKLDEKGITFYYRFKKTDSTMEISVRKVYNILDLN